MNKTKDKAKIEIEIPFDGFYETHHGRALEDAIGGCLYHQPLDWYMDLSQGYPDHNDPEVTEALDAVTEHAWDVYSDINEEAEREYCKAYAEDYALDTGLEIVTDTMEVQSPQYYNFSTDRMFVDVTLESLEAFLADVPADLYAEKVEDRYTSYDGFMSFFSNDYKNGDQWTRPLTEYDACQIRTLLEVASKYKKAGHADHRMYYVDAPNELVDGLIPAEAYEKAQELAERADELMNETSTEQAIHPDQMSIK